MGADPEAKLSAPAPFDGSLGYMMFRLGGHDTD